MSKGWLQPLRGCVTIRRVPKLSIRIDLDDDGRLGPGKIALLENVRQHGSISAAGRAMGMSYKRSWDLVAELNASFGHPLVEAFQGGRSGGGARLTELGSEVVFHYRAIESKAQRAAARHLKALKPTN